MKKKKILIYSCTGGGGHIAAKDALVDYLGNDYDLTVKWMFSEILQPIDILRFITRNKINVGTAYNGLAKRKFHKLINIMYKIGAQYFSSRQKTIAKIVGHHFDELKPDAVISVIPVVNGALLAACKKRNIPFILIPTDLDAQAFLYGLHNPNYQNFCLSIPYNTPEIWAVFKPAHIKENYFCVNGFPIKKAFFEPFDIQAFKNKHAIDLDKKIIMTMMGANSCDAMVQFAQQLIKVKEPFHLLLACGTNGEIAQQLQQITFPPHISSTILGYTDEIPMFMKISDVYIGKAGSLSFNEAIYSNIPMILDGTSSVMVWEQFNHHFVEYHEFGAVLRRLDHLPRLVERFLCDLSYYHFIKHNLATFNTPNFGKNINLLIHNMLNIQ